MGNGEARFSLFVILGIFALLASNLFAGSISDCTNLSMANTVYTLTASPSSAKTCFNITAANVTLDCASNTITGNNASTTYGVNVTNKINATIKNCIIKNYSVGIFASGDSSDYLNLTNNTINLTYASSCSISNGACAAIFVSGGDYAYIDSNNVFTSSATNAYGISLYSGASNNTVINNNASFSNYGFNNYFNSNNTFSNNSAFGTKIGFYTESSSINNFSGNFAYNSSSIGFGFYTSSTNNYLSNNYAYNSTSYGFRIYSSSNNNLTGNNATLNADGFYIDTNSINNTISNNSAFSSTDTGFYLLSSSNNNTIFGNNAYNSNIGFGLSASSNNNLSGNYAHNSTNYGFILFSSSDNNTLTGNYAYGATSSYEGFALTTCANNSFAGNYAYNSTNSFYIFDTGSINFSGNYAYNSTSSGFHFSSVTNSAPSGNNATLSGTGFYLDSCSGNNFSNNRAFNSSTAGFALYSSLSNNLSSNYAYNSTSYALYMALGSDSNSFSNNNFSLAGTALFWEDSSGGTGNTFLHNNITATAWVSDLQGGNDYNDSSAGNIYYFANSTPSWSVYNISYNSSANWAQYGTSRPFNSTHAPTYFAGDGNPNDFHPYTLNAVPLISISNQISFSNDSVLHSFNATASATNLSSPISSASITSSVGTCSQISNSSSSLGFSATFNCSHTLASNVSIRITFTDGNANSAQTDASTNTYPNFAAIAPTLAILSPNYSIYSSPNISLNYTAVANWSGLSKCWYSLDGDGNTTLAGCANSSFLISTAGAHLVRLYANDTNNTISIASISFAYDSQTTSSIANSSTYSLPVGNTSILMPSNYSTNQIIINSSTSETTNVTLILPVNSSTSSQTNVFVNTSINISRNFSSTQFNFSIPANANISGPANWSGELTLPTIQSSSDYSFTPSNNGTSAISEVILIGFGNQTLTSDKAFRLLFINGGGKSVGYAHGAGALAEITSVCSDDSQTTGNALASGGDCKFDYGAGSNLAVWTKHLSSFGIFSTTYPASSSSSRSASSNGGGEIRILRPLPPAPEPAKPPEVPKPAEVVPPAPPAPAPVPIITPPAPVLPKEEQKAQAIAAVESAKKKVNAVSSSILDNPLVPISIFVGICAALYFVIQMINRRKEENSP